MGTGMGNTVLRGRGVSIEDRAKYIADEFCRQLTEGGRSQLQKMILEHMKVAIEEATKDLVDEDELDKQKDSSYKLGEHSGLGLAAEFLLQKATGCFREVKDEEARRLRDLSKDLKEKSEKAHPRYGKKPSDP